MEDTYDREKKSLYQDYAKAQKMMPQAPQNQMVTVAMMVAGIVLGGKAQLSAMSLEIPHPAKPASLEKRMHRLVKNERFEVETNYSTFAYFFEVKTDSGPVYTGKTG